MVLLSQDLIFLLIFAAVLDAGDSNVAYYTI